MEKRLSRIPSRKRSRPSVLPRDLSVSTFRPYEVGGEKPEERTKIDVPEKRERIPVTESRTDVQTSAPARSSGYMDGDREALRLQNNLAAQDGERALSIDVDGCKKSKMKKKQSRIKSDASPSTMTIKPANGSRELEKDVQQILPTDAWPRLNDVNGFRPRVANGAVRIGKPEDNSEPISLGVRSSISKVGRKRSPLIRDISSCPAASEKERVNVVAVNKKNIRDDFSLGTGSNVLCKLPPVIQKTTVINDWELPHFTLKFPTSVGASNRRQMPSASSSTPVGDWAQKISCTAKRTNFVPAVSNNDDFPASDTISDVAGHENWSGSGRSLSSNSPQQITYKADQFSTVVLSDSEESGADEVKSLGKGQEPDEMDEKANQNSQKVLTMVLPPRKNKLLYGDELGDSSCRKGRSGRGFNSTRSLMPVGIQKLGNVGTARQIRSFELGFGKHKREVGCPTHKLSEREAYTHQKYTTSNAADFLDDGREELLAAAVAVVNSAHNFLSPFWRKMEPYFSFISDVDIAFLKQQEHLVPTSQAPSAARDIGGPIIITNEFGLIEPERDFNKTKKVELVPDHLVPGTMNEEITLCQRLIAALISEEANEEVEFDVHGTELEAEKFRKSPLNIWASGNCQPSMDADLNGSWLTVKGRSLNDFEHDMQDTPLMPVPEKYDKLSINERAFMEMRSIGLCPERLPDLLHMEDDESIENNIIKLKHKYHEQVTKKKALLGKLLNSALGMREHQEQEFEHCALNRLVVMAYEKYKTCWGSNASGARGVCTRMAKQTALVFVKRTLERCKKFEATGKSCFSEPLYRDIFISGSFRKSSADGESNKQYADTFGGSSEVQVSGSMGTQRITSLNNNPVYSSNGLLSGNDSSERTIARDVTYKVKKRKLLLNVPSGFGGSRSIRSKRKRWERDEDKKGNNIELSSGNGMTKIGQPVSSSIKVEAKSDTKPKRKAARLSGRVGSLRKLTEQPESMLGVPKSSGTTASGSTTNKKDEFGLGALNDSEVLDGLGRPGQDIGSWLDINDGDAGLQDDENCMGLEVPMDDLADLNMMV